MERTCFNHRNHAWIMTLFSLIPRFLPVFQCCTLIKKTERSLGTRLNRVLITINKYIPYDIHNHAAVYCMLCACMCMYRQLVNNVQARCTCIYSNLTTSIYRCSLVPRPPHATRKISWNPNPSPSYFFV